MFTPEQMAVLAALEARRGPDVVAQEVTTANVVVTRPSGEVERYFIQPDGETRRFGGGSLVVPEHLYGTFPSERSGDRAGWGSGFPRRAEQFRGGGVVASGSAE